MTDPRIDKLADVLVRYPESRVTVVGHTDSRGSDDYNLFLSRDRARAVVEELTSRGVAADRLIAFGRGESEPRASNETSTGRALNRRVEILLEPSSA